MLGSVEIRNFKSVRHVDFEARRVNILIGEPNTGKSNIIEALALLSSKFESGAFREVFRVHTLADLFFDQQISNKIEVRADDQVVSVRFERGQFNFAYSAKALPGNQIVVDKTANFSSWLSIGEGVRFYRFKGNVQINFPDYGPLASPFGQNLVTLLYTNKELRRRVSDLFRSRGFRLEIKPVDMQLLLAKSVDDELYSFPYDSISETWRRIVFFMAVLETNHNSTILLDEPEANTFPFYTTYLAERIALDESNQFFLTTHNPYVLSSIIGKAQEKDLAVFVATMENFATRLSSVSPDGLARILDYGPDAFLNLDKLIVA